MLSFNLENNVKKIDTKWIEKKYQKEVDKIWNDVVNKTAAGSNMTGWLNLKEIYCPEEIQAMKAKANEWTKAGIKDIVVIGIGGSYIGVKAAIDMIKCGDETGPRMIYIHNMNSNYMLSIMQKLEGKKFGIIVISKSGTTLEPAIGFRLFRNLLEKNVGSDNSKKLIVAVTDEQKGTLHDFAKAKGYTMFRIPNTIGGRYSTLTPVGLFAMASSGIDIEKVLNGAKHAINDLNNTSLSQNTAYQYACCRHYLHTSKHIQVENFITYDPFMYMICQQWQQLFGESEGKDFKAMYPTYSLFTTDLHALGQYLQQGTRNFMETTLMVKKPNKDMKLVIEDNDDGLKYLNGKTLDSLTKKAFEGTIKAHTEKGKVNNFIIEISEADEFHYGYLFMWLSYAAMMSGYLLKINPFNQPGVEDYKSNMFALLGRNK